MYEDSDDCEDLADYCSVEGYHPVALGQRFHGRYTIVQKLGWGHFSTVWLVRRQGANSFAALKIQRSNPTHIQAAEQQLDLLIQLQKHESSPSWQQWLKLMQERRGVQPTHYRPILLIDNFLHYGIRGKHCCFVFELLGPNLLNLIERKQRMALWLVKQVTRDVLFSLVYLHEECGIIHTDLKPENIMIKLPQAVSQRFVKQLAMYEVLPVSMKYLENIKKSKNGKNTKKNQKKKEKKKLKKIAENQKNGKITSKQGEDKEFQEKDKEEVENQEKQEQGQKQQKTYYQQQNDVKNKQQNQKKQQQHQNNQNMSKIEKINHQKQKTQKSEKQSQYQKNQKTKNKLNSHEQNQNNQVYKEQDKNNKNQGIMLNKQQNKIQQVCKTQQVNQQKIQKNDLQKQQQEHYLRWKQIKIELNKDLHFKIADMGNACFTTKHFTQSIQTREYRSPQVILGCYFEPNTDIWSLGCTVYEMLTDRFLFKPKCAKGVPKDEDHLFKMIQVLGPIPKQMLTTGSQTHKFFNTKGKLRHGHPTDLKPISKLLVDKGYEVEQAIAIESFLLPMLRYSPKQRISARECLQSQWLWK